MMSPDYQLKNVFFIFLITRLSSNISSGSIAITVINNCDINNYGQLGYTCGCSAQALECQSKNLSDLTFFDIPDDTEVLDLSRNLIEYLTESTLTWQAPVCELFLSHNLIKNISGSSFSQLERLQILDLSNNHLDHLQPGLFHPLIYLTTLYLSYNHLTQLSCDLFSMTNFLSKLDISNNPLHNITQVEPAPLTHLSNLLYLDMSNCSLKLLNLAFLENNTQLKHLRLNSNLLEYVPMSSLIHTGATLQLLDMSQNPVGFLPIHGFHGLHGLNTLIISNMPDLEKIEALAFNDLISLTTLQCSNNNKLSYIDSKAFKDTLYQDGSSMVSILNLSGNNLTSLPKDLLNWSSIQSIQLEGNPWSCSCSLSWMANLSSSLSLSDQPTCASPSNVATQSIDVFLHHSCSAGSDWLIPILLTVFISVFLIVAYIAAQTRWPNKLPAVSLFGKRGPRNYHILQEGINLI